MFHDPLRMSYVLNGGICISVNDAIQLLWESQERVNRGLRRGELLRLRSVLTPSAPQPPKGLLGCQ